MGRLLALGSALLLAVTAASCGGGEAADDAAPMNGMGEVGDMMGGRALGAEAETTVLARARLMDKPPARAAWIAFEVTLEPGQRVEHRHPFSTVYAAEGPHLLTVGADEVTLMAGRGAAVQADAVHVHAAPVDVPSVFWDVLLTEPSADLPGAPEADRVFASEPLEGVPDDPVAALIDVTLPPAEGQTSVHTHPGPELIYVTDGRFQYESAIGGTRMVGPGDVEEIPTRTPVQKRNPMEEPARFLSWFLVDPDEPFASPADF